MIKMAGTNFSSEVSIYELSRERLYAVMPTIVYLCVLIVVGLIGNILVVVVFGFKMKKQSTYRIFILVMAMFDLTACCVGMPGLVVELARPYFFYSGSACKMLRYGYHVIACGSSITHLLIGMDRYRRICRATSQQISTSKARTWSVGILAIALIVTLPVIIMSDSVPQETRIYNISGHQCDISNGYAGTVYPILYSSLQSVVIFVTIIVLIILYSLIGHKLNERLKFLRFANFRKRSKNHEDNENKKTNHVFRNKVTPLSEAVTDISEHESISHRPVSEHEIVSGLHQKDVSKVIQVSQLRLKQSREQTSKKMTVTTFAIMVVYIVSFVPLECLELITFFNRNIENEMTYTQMVFYRLGFHTYALNNVANPLVYYFMDNEFKRHCKELLSDLRCKLCSLLIQKCTKNK